MSFGASTLLPMEPFHIAIILRPLANFLFFALVVLPIEWALFRLIPRGRLKVVLFKVRSGEQATPADKRLMTVASVAAIVLVVVFIGFVSWWNERAR